MSKDMATTTAMVPLECAESRLADTEEHSAGCTHKRSLPRQDDDDMAADKDGESAAKLRKSLEEKNQSYEQALALAKGAPGGSPNMHG